MRIAFAGDRDVSVQVLDYLLETGCVPLALLVSAPERATHAAELIEKCSYLKPDRIFRGVRFRDPDAIESLRELNLDLLVCVHFPYLNPIFAPFDFEVGCFVELRRGEGSEPAH